MPISRAFDANMSIVLEDENGMVGSRIVSAQHTLKKKRYWCPVNM